MDQVNPVRSMCIGGGISGMIGVLMIGSSFAINTGPPLDADNAQMIAFGATHFRQVMWGAWLQSVGPQLIMIFALILVHVSGATQRLSGWVTLLGASVLMMVSLAEVFFYMSALGSTPETIGQTSNAIGHAIQHLYFIVAAPAVFFPLGVVLDRSRILPAAFGYLAILLGAGFFILGITSLGSRILSPAVTAFAAVQAIWWFGAAVALVARSSKLSNASPGVR